MRLNRTRIAVLLAALATMAAAAAPAASAGTTPGTRPMAPATSPAPCTLSSVWLRVWGTTGEHCYSGNGAIIVALPGVREAQVLGLHQACLYSVSPVRATCVIGPRLVFINPPIYVQRITLTTY